MMVPKHSWDRIMSWPGREFERRRHTPKQPPNAIAGGNPGHGVVFLLEPRADTREALVELLGEAGYAVEGFETLPPLLAALGGREADCVIADASPPDALGLHLLNLLRAVGQPPVILTAGGTELTVAVLAMRAGAADFLEKPISRPVLLSRLRRLLADKHLNTNGE
jgi:two-component system CheB/CheR fusion protein